MCPGVRVGMHVALDLLSQDHLEGWGQQGLPREECVHLVSGEQPMLPCYPRDECGCLPSPRPSARAAALGPRLPCLAWLCRRGAPVPGVWSQETSWLPAGHSSVC